MCRYRLLWRRASGMKGARSRWQHGLGSLLALWPLGNPLTSLNSRFITYLSGTFIECQLCASGSRGSRNWHGLCPQGAYILGGRRWGRASDTLTHSSSCHGEDNSGSRERGDGGAVREGLPEELSEGRKWPRVSRIPSGSFMFTFFGGFFIPTGMLLSDLAFGYL